MAGNRCGIIDERDGTTDPSVRCGGPAVTTITIMLPEDWAGMLKLKEMEQEIPICERHREMIVDGGGT